MDVGVGGVGHVVVDDVRDVFHVEAARRDVGGDHDVVYAFLEASERGLALSLRAVAVQAGCLVTCPPDLLLQFFRATARAREDQHGVGVYAFEQFDQQRGF